jgi:CubicO group peptidase (beta-lactamase class C family)
MTSLAFLLRSRLWLASLVAVAMSAAAPIAQTPTDAAPGKAAARPPSAATRGGFSIERLRRVDALLQRYIDENKLAGAVALVLRDGQPVYEKAVGWSDKEAGRKMTMDTVFRIASQTKALTSTAVLQLMEEGRLSLADPASKYIPAFANTTVSVAGPNGTSTIVPAKRPITIQDLLTHTAGISYGTEPRVAAAYEPKGLGPAAGRGWYFADKDDGVCPSIERLATVPFLSQPGEAWVYGYNTDVLGCIVERITGQSLAEVIKAKITAPLGLSDTQFFLPAAQRTRLAAVYGNGATGAIERAPEGASGQGHYVDGPRRSFSGGAGLLSTAHDYARFLEAIRLGGALDGARILSPRAVQLMTTNQVGTLHSTTGLGFGLGFETTDRYGANGMDSVGSFGWSGAYGTTYRVDPEARLVMVLMIQLIPNTTDIRSAFPTAVYQALVDPAARAVARAAGTH